MIAHLLLLTLFACPDPTTAAELGNPGPGGAAPGSPGGPQSAMDGPPPAPGNFNVADGAGVVVSGTLAYPGNQSGQLRLDFLATEDDAPPRLLHVEKLDAFGSYSVSTPPNTGSVAIVAFVDVNNDGPSPTDPAGMIRINIEESNIESADITLSDEPDLGDLTPGDVGPSTANDATDGAAPEAPEIDVASKAAEQTLEGEKEVETEAVDPQTPAEQGPEDAATKAEDLPTPAEQGNSE